VPESGIARLAGDVRITRGQNQLNGQEAEVNMKTGVARLLRGSDDRVTGLIVPNDTSNQSLGNQNLPTAGPPAAAPALAPNSTTDKPAGAKP
jgi:lipopolysaccharide export system protein LptA